MKQKKNLGRKLLAFLLTLAMVVGLMPGMSLTAKAATYSDYISDDLQAGDILKPGARISAEKINVTLQANGWGDENEVSTSEKQFSVEMMGLEISDYDNGSIRDDEYNYCYPYANGEKVSAWEVVSFDGGEEPWDPKTITLKGFAPPAREPVMEISSDTMLSESINGYITITDNVTLDLAGYTITGGGYHSTIIINNDCTLTLTDSSTGKTGKITGGGGDAGGGVAVCNNATFNMQGGTINGNTATNGGGVALGGGATFTMSGGTITGNSADNGGGVYSSGSSFSMTGGTISNNSAGDFNYGGGVLIQSGNFSMSGTAAITGNDGGSEGGGVYFGGSTFTMSGGSISGGNHATSGGGVYVNSGTFNMTGGTITGNSTDGWAGGGVYTCSIFNMSGSAAITGNSASTEGGGVYQNRYSSAVFTMTGGSITNNSSGSKGYAGVCIREDGTFNLSGGAVIDGNTHGSTEEDICLYPGSVVKVTGALTMENTMSVRLTKSDGTDNWTGIIAQGSGYTLTETDGAKFIASTTNRRAKYDSENSKEILVALYTVTYNANGATSGTVPTDENNPYESGSTVTVLGNTGELAKTGNTFNGWNTAANGSGTPYAAGATFDITGNTTLYAQWKHIHRWSYTAGTGENANTITATCTNHDGCPLADSDYKATLTISANGGTYDGTTSYEATVTDEKSIKGDAVVNYYKATDSDERGDALSPLTTAPTNAGRYWAEITLGTGEDATAHVVYTIEKAAEAAPAADINLLYINYPDETISAKPEYEVASDDNGTEITDFSSILDETTPTVYIRKTASDDNHTPSVWVPVTLSSRPAAPTGLGSTNAADGASEDGTITGVNDTMEYSADGTNWTPVNGTTITGLKAGTYKVRVKATETAPCGNAAEVIVGSNYKALDETVSVIIKKGDSAIGDTVPVVDDELTADCEASNIIYQWYRGGEPIDGATEGTYTLTKYDVGKAIAVQVIQTKKADGTNYGENDRPKKMSGYTEAVVKKAGPAAPASVEEAGFIPDYVNETFTIGEGYEVSSSDSEDEIITGNSLTDVIDGTRKIYIRVKETEDTKAGAWLEVTLSSRPDAPTELGSTNATDGASEDGTITGVNDTMEYSADGTNWTPVNGTTITGLKAGTYKVRVKATGGDPCGNAADVTVESNYKALDETVSVIIKKGDSAIGDTVPVVDDELTADCEASNIIYQWYRGGEPINGATEGTYKLTKNDVGKAITVQAIQTKKADGTNYGENDRPKKMSGSTEAVVKKDGPAAPASVEEAGFTPDYVNETFTIGEGYEVSSSNDKDGIITDNLLTEVLDGTGKIYIRAKETDDTKAGVWLEVTLPARPVAPTELGSTNATDGASEDGTITGVSETMEYSADGTNWTPVNGTTITGLKAGTYKVRVKATDDKPAGEIAEVTVGSRKLTLTDRQKPTEKTNLKYNGSDQALLDAPADGLPDGAVEIIYAIGENTDTAPEPDADGTPDDQKRWLTSIPKATAAGTYYVWYKVVGDENHTDSKPKCIEVTIAEAKKEETDTSIETEVNVSEDAPAVKVGNLDEELAAELLTDEEKEEYNQGTPVLVYLDVKTLAKADVPEIDLEAVEKVTKKDDYTYGECLDISLWKRLGNGTPIQIQDTNGNLIKITVTIPDTMKSAPAGYTRTFRIIRVHDGVATVMAEGTGATLEVSSDKFSSYFLVYKDTKGAATTEATTATSTTEATTAASTSDATTATSTTEAAKTSPKTGDSMPIALLIVLMLSAAGVLVFMDQKKKKN